MSAKSERRQSPSPSETPSSPSSYLVIDSNPEWLPDDPWGLVDNHEDAKKDIWTKSWHGKHWDKCRDMLKNHDTKALQEWNDDINTQLLVSSLLAAVAGGFVVESQKRLSEDPAIISAVILFRIARQLNESMALPDSELTAFGGPSAVERAFNSLFSASLALSLANVTLGLLCLQWIRGMKYEPPGLYSRAYPDFRHGRYLGFERWGAKSIMSALPLLLLAALLTFFAGILAFASDNDWISSIPLYVILPSVIAIALFTTFAPGIVIVLNSAFRKGSNFPSVPPFRSLQSWIAMKGLIHIVQAISSVLKVHPFGAFLSLHKCLDWGQIDLLWSSWAIKDSEGVFLLPIIISAGSAEDMNVISNIFEESGITTEPAFRKLRILRELACYSERLPAITKGSIGRFLFAELVGLINVGIPPYLLSNAFDVEEHIALDTVHTDATLQLVNSFSFLCRTTDTSFEGFWNLFWRALSDMVQTAPIEDNITSVLFNDTLGSMQIALANPSTDTQMVFQRGFKIFIKGIAYEVDHPSSWSRSEGGSTILSTIVLHPIWGPARETIATLPPGAEHTTAAQKCMQTLDRIRQKFPPFPATIAPDNLPLQEEPSRLSSSHISIDVAPDHYDERTAHVVASPHAGVDTGPEEDKDAGQIGPPIFSKDQFLTTVTSTPLALPTPPVESATSPLPTEI